MTEKCKWWEESKPIDSTDEDDCLIPFCNIMDTFYVACHGEICLCECDQQRIAEEKAEAIDRKAEEIREKDK